MVQHASFPEFLRKKDQQLFINGEWCDSHSDQRIEVTNPATGERLATLARGNQQDVDSAVLAARRAFEGPWSKFTPAQRQKVLIRFAEIFEQHYDELAMIESLDRGAPHARLRSLRDGGLRGIYYYSAQACNIHGQVIPNSLPGSITSMVIKAPIGVIGGIIPWNGPIFGQMNVIGPVLATGCTAVLKPAEDVSLTVLRTAELLIEAGVPPGVINVVTGLGREAGASLASHPGVDRVVFTGSTATGREIIRASASNIKRVQLELGGKSPDIVFADADFEKAVPGVAMGIYSNSGQVCLAGSRILVERRAKDEFVERFAAYTKRIPVGDPMNPDTVLGPLVSKRQLETVSGYVAKGVSEGGAIITGGNQPGGDLAKGFYFEPTIFDDVHNNMTVAREEIFGPVATIIPFDTQEEALSIANDTDYGLAAGVWSKDLGVALKMLHGIRAGTVWINSYGLLDAAVGFGGLKQSGYGWKGGEAQIDGFLYQKAAYINGG